MDSTSYRNWIFTDDRPIATEDDDLLWHNDNIHEKLQHIAERIIGPLYLETSKYSFQISNSMTFAIYGRWGMGKSSALKMLKEKVLCIAKREGVSERFKLCEYVASAYEPFAMDARITLAQCIFTTLSGSNSRAIQLLGEQINSYREGIIKTGPDRHIIARDSYTLQEIATNLSKLIDFDQILQEKMLGNDGKSCVLLILIDDLDRCTDNFIWQILNFIQQLSDVPNIFFALAVEEKCLKSAVDKLSSKHDNETDSDLALEKYIQHEISVPNMSEDSLPHFIEKLLFQCAQVYCRDSLRGDRVPVPSNHAHLRYRT
jgi:KAP family P-loop domain